MHLRDWALPAVIALVLFGLMLGGETVAAALRYERGAVLSGEVWRLLTAHLVHADWAHLAWNVGGLVLVFALFAGEYSRRDWLLVMLASTAAIDLGFLLLEPDLACPQYGIYAGFGLGHRAAISIGTNPHYGGSERRIEPYLLDFEGDLYGKRLVVELWEHLRDEAVFESEAALVAQIAADVDATKRARRPEGDS